MNKILVILMLCSGSAFAQEWQPYKMNNGVEVSFPSPPTIIDTTTAFKIAFLDSAGIRLHASEEFFANYRYTKEISNRDELIAFYNHLNNLIANNTPGAVPGISVSEPVGNLLMQRSTLSVPGESPISCEGKVLLLNQRVYVMRACRYASDTTTLDLSNQFFASLKISSDNIYLDQFVTTQDNVRSIGESLPIVGGLLFLVWFVLYIMLIFMTRSAEAPRMLTILFAIVRWSSAALFFLLFATMLVGIMFDKFPAETSRGWIMAFCAAFGLGAILIATLRPPSFRKPVI